MTIIASTDFSEIAENAVQYAASIAKVSKYKLVLYHGYTLPLHAAHAHISAENFQKLLNSAIDNLKNKAKALSEKYDIEVIPEFSFSYIGDELIELIKKHEAKGIVIGMAEKSLEQDLMGNTTTAIIKNINIPVLAVPLNAKFNGLKKIIFACDNPKEISNDILEKINDTAQKLGGELEIFSVDEQVDELKTENAPSLITNVLDTQLQGINYYYKNVRSNAVIEAIKQEVEDYQADLLIMAPKQYGFWASIVHRSKTRLMASGMNIPLLSIPQ